MTIDEEVEIARRIREGDIEAISTLIIANLKFVVSVAKGYQNQGLSLPDLINEGNIGLIKAATRFDETRGFKFISFAVWWIRQSILQAIANDSRLIRLPVHKVGLLQKMKKSIREFEQKENRSPNSKELADYMGIEPEEIEMILPFSGKHTSLDGGYLDHDNDEKSLVDIIIDEEAFHPDSKTESDSLKIDLMRFMSLLPERDQKVLSMYYGIGQKELSLEEIGERLNMTRERARQIKEIALKKIYRNSKAKEILGQYL